MDDGEDRNTERRREEEKDARGGDGKGERKRGEEEISVWEWLVAGASAALVLALIGYLVLLGVGSRASPPALSVQRDTVLATDHGYVVTFVARNSGGSTARGVEIRGELVADTGTVEKRTATLHFVPAGASRRGGLFFQHDPSRYRLELSPEGYDVP